MSSGCVASRRLVNGAYFLMLDAAERPVRYAGTRITTSGRRDAVIVGFKPGPIVFASNATRALNLSLNALGAQNRLLSF